MRSMNILRRRLELIQEFFFDGIPRLWCPPLTHYKDDGTIDFERMAAHLAQLVPWVKGYLIPGSTGDGWELDEQQTLGLVEFAAKQGRKHGITALLGVLRTGPAATKEAIQTMVSVLQRLTAVNDVMTCLHVASVCGFAICPPAGKTLSQDTIYEGLAEVMDMGLPTALYQLPQVTENEVAPETFERLVENYPNLIFFNDSSGEDRVATSDVDKGGIFLVRAAEGDYARRLKDANGAYDGFLLSTANCFADTVSAIIEHVERGDLQSAGAISDTLSRAFQEVFGLVQPLSYGNAFANANKAIDHFKAFGPRARQKEGPMLHARVRLPERIISGTGAILTSYGLMPEKGYLE
jgi:dihydrodipicolinate synthase/N-acetylneuraminate lyase